MHLATGHRLRAYKVGLGIPSNTIEGGRLQAVFCAFSGSADRDALSFSGQGKRDET